ncbi:tellurite resistance TerB family protein [Microbulbifer sp. SSSA002]|uniref:tellurite resistance TerB family protein n=1 Tax=unclassified Microbulbifer TaxID=2619833 RepID=UPI004039E9FF
MLGWLKTNTLKARETLATEVGKYKNRSFMEAVANGCALMSAADGEITSDEKMKMAGFINNSSELKIFNMKDVIKVFNDACEKIDFDFQIGQAEALKIISKVKDNETQARLLVRVVCAVGGSDGDFDNDEKAVARLICLELGLNPVDFEL